MLKGQTVNMAFIASTQNVKNNDSRVFEGRLQGNEITVVYTFTHHAVCAWTEWLLTSFTITFKDEA